MNEWVNITHPYPLQTSLTLLYILVVTCAWVTLLCITYTGWKEALLIFSVEGAVLLCWNNSHKFGKSWENLVECLFKSSAFFFKLFLLLCSLQVSCQDIYLVCFWAFPSLGLPFALLLSLTCLFYASPRLAWLLLIAPWLALLIPNQSLQCLSLPILFPVHVAARLSFLRNGYNNTISPPKRVPSLLC